MFLKCFLDIDKNTYSHYVYTYKLSSEATFPASEVTVDKNSPEPDNTISGLSVGTCYDFRFSLLCNSETGTGTDLDLEAICTRLSEIKYLYLSNFSMLGAS